MGKKGRKTRWRTLTIADEHSDSEESNQSVAHYPKQKPFYNRFTYSSQSTPTRRYQQYDGTKSTRSSSTASENKITFNEDEYTRITTPRQDVLFKKGYLNKPKNYQTQTSTGNSTTSTGNGTPDHQSTDLEYESQFVFPNGFVDQNGIYYVNSFEPYPLMIYNPTTYYQEFSNYKSKRSSTGSLSESMSPNNEEASQDLSGTEPSELNQQIYNVIYPGFYFNSNSNNEGGGRDGDGGGGGGGDDDDDDDDNLSQPQDVVNRNEFRKLKRRKRRKVTKLIEDGTTSEYTEDDDEEEQLSDEVFAEQTNEKDKINPQLLLLNGLTKDEHSNDQEHLENDEQGEQDDDDKEESGNKTPKYDLKPDAKEFVPRAFRQPEVIPIVLPHPIPILNPMGEINHAFISPLPVNFIPQPNPNFINFSQHETIDDNDENDEDEIDTTRNDDDDDDDDDKAITKDAPVPIKLSQTSPTNQIDIAKIVSKLELAAKEQEKEEKKPNVKTNYNTKITNNDFKLKPRPNAIKTSTQKINDKIRDVKESPTSPINKDKRKKTIWKQPTTYQTNNTVIKTNKCYSETVKAKPTNLSPSTTHQHYPHHHYHQQQQQQQQTKICEKFERNMIRSQTIRETLLNTPNKWIPVSRKKKKNRNIEEIEDVDEIISPDNKNEIDLFESYDINLLEDVIPPTKTIDESKESKSDKDCRLEEESDVLLNINIPEVSDIEKMLLKQHNITTINEIVEEEKPKKKMKKNPKTATKRVIITDIYLSTMKNDKEIEPPMKENKASQIETKKPELPPDVIIPERKVKKKKKKTVKQNIVVNSESSSTTTLNIVHTYDLLLENSLDESFNKTNDEISQELDRMIQRGIYNNLEEKIKSLNNESNDEFFKTILNNISRESSVEKSPYIKTGDLGKILKTSPLIKPLNLVGDFTTTTNTKSLFLDKPKKNDIIKCNGIVHDNDGDDCEKTKYPITQAVKEWMTKTRETTPEIELLKSPSEIFKEFHDEKIIEEDEDNDEEEITLFSNSSSHLTNKPDELLDCWEEMKNVSSTQINYSKSKQQQQQQQQQNGCAKNYNLVQNKDDEFEIYESLYGKNEDYLKLKAEIDDKRKIPKHGNLPYRAICCSIM